MPIGGRSTHTRSTGTTDQREATRKAEDFWGDCLLAKRGVTHPSATGKGTLPLPEVRFDRVADSWLDRKLAESGSSAREKRAQQDRRSAVLGGGGCATYFGNRDIGGITTDCIRQFLIAKAAGSKKGDLAPASKHRTLSVLNQIFKYAYERRLIASIPLMPKFPLKQKPRGWFTKEEYQRLYRAARRLASIAKMSGDVVEHGRWMEMADFIPFMVNTFLRPSEWAEIKHRHVAVHDDPQPHLGISIPAGKTGARTIRSMPRAAQIYDRIKARSDGSPDSYIFLPSFANRQTAKERMHDRFEELLQHTGLKTDGLGNKRVTYSLRHTSLMFRILYGDGVDIVVLAKNAGTSVRMLEGFYLSHLDAGMKIDNLHSFKGKKKGDSGL